MRRWLHVAPEAATLLPASHLAQMHNDASNDDNVCVACGALVDGPAAELVVLQDTRMVLARLAHPACVKSGAYEWEGTTAAVQALTTRPEGLDVATLVAWRRAPSPRALILIEPRIQVSLDTGAEDSLERLFARPLGLQPVSQPVTRLQPSIVPGEIRDHRDGLQLVTDALRITIPARPVLRQQWRDHADGGIALVLVGRGLGIGGPEDALLHTLDEALRSRPVWGAALHVSDG
jgi:hypothetical protein